ncbi:hypothetical protein DDE82_003838 [Stemphylium lycopersici]|nr:hypothetical protein TW65_07361 [Stemphylium lycopersici]RAR05649.1 hypothetical protein DDE82_003838 [Stemphylium lycopersici]
MPGLVIKPSKRWEGAVTWDGYFLRMHIKTVMASYDRNDPRTWPTIDSLTQTDNGSDYRHMRTPPAFLAYSQELMQVLVESLPMKRTKEKHTMWRSSVKLHNRFRDYPLNFDQEGTLRPYPHILPRELQAWRILVTGLDDMEAEKNSKPLAAGKVSRETGVVGNVSPAMAYLKIMKTLTGADTLPQAEIAELQEKLGNTMESLYKERERAEKSETDVKQLKVKLKKAEKETITVDNQLSNVEKELQVAQKEAVEANERIVTVWSKMQKLQSARPQKRKALEDASTSQQKVARRRD